MNKCLTTLGADSFIHFVVWRVGSIYLRRRGLKPRVLIECWFLWLTTISDDMQPCSWTGHSRTSEGVTEGVLVHHPVLVVNTRYSTMKTQCCFADLRIPTIRKRHTRSWRKEIKALTLEWTKSPLNSIVFVHKDLVWSSIINEGSAHRGIQGRVGNYWYMFVGVLRDFPHKRAISIGTSGKPNQRGIIHDNLRKYRHEDCAFPLSARSFPSACSCFATKVAGKQGPHKRSPDFRKTKRQYLS